MPQINVPTEYGRQTLGEKINLRDPMFWFGILIGFIVSLLSFLEGRLLDDSRGVFLVRLVLAFAAVYMAYYGTQKPRWHFYGEQLIIDSRGACQSEMGAGISSAPAWVVPILYVAAAWIPETIQFGIVGVVGTLLILHYNVFGLEDARLRLSDKISDCWYGSRVEEYFEANPGRILFGLGLLLLVVGLVVIVWLAKKEVFSLWWLILAAVLMITGGVSGVIGVGIKSAETSD